MKRHAALVAALLVGASPGAAGQQNVRLSTPSARFHLTLSAEPGETFTTHEHFQFESATSKLIHTSLSDGEGADDASTSAVVTGVHVEKMRNSQPLRAGEIVDAEETATLALESVVSVTFSEVGLHMALERSAVVDGSEDTNDLAQILTKAVSSDDMHRALVAAELIPEEVKVLELSFSEFDGSVYERGVTATETDIVSKQKNDGWPMFFAGVLISVVLVSIVGVLYYVVKKERGEWPFDKSRDDRSNSSVHYNGDLDLEVATSASGVLGLKGHHPRASTDAENAHPNRNAYRRKTPGSSSSRTATTSSHASTTGKTVRSGASRASSKHPLGITDMKRLSSFLTPQKAKSDAMVMYDVERLTRT
ncbi:hypothetical protein ACHAXT_007305 [Thalassiosira profunda]